MINNKDDLFRIKLKTEKVEVADWGEFCIQELTAERQQNFEKQINQKKDQVDLMCLLIIDSVVDDAGKYIMDESDLPKLKQLPTAPLIELFNHILKINKIGDAEIKEAAKNS